MRIWRIVSLVVVVLMSVSACTLTAPDAPPPTSTRETGVLPTGEAPADILTPDALRTQTTPVAAFTATPPPPADDTCRANTDTPLAMRVSPDIVAQEVTILGATTSPTVIGRTGDNTWLRVQSAGASGWVDTSAVTLTGNCLGVPIADYATATPQFTATPSVPTATIKVNLNVRRGASVRFAPALGQFAPGDTTQIIAVNPAGDWYKVVFGNSQGWIYNDPAYIEVSGNLSGLAIDAGPATPTPTNTPIPSTPTPTLDPNTNYLQDPSFEGAYTGRDGPDFNIPAAWQGFYIESPREYEWQNIRPFAFPHITAPEIQDGRQSLNFTRDYGTFTAVVYQQVSVPVGITVRGSAWSWVHTCDPQPAICNSEASSNARVRIGIDPTGGTNVYSGNIVWSGFATPHDRWEQLNVSARASGGTVTLFLYGTQDLPKGLNRLYWDNAGLFVGG